MSHLPLRAPQDSRPHRPEISERAEGVKMGIRWIARSLAVAAVVSIALLAPPLFGQDGAPELSAVTVSSTDGATVVQIRTQGSLDAAVISDFSTASPPTVVIDMMGVDAGDVGAVVGGASFCRAWGWMKPSASNVVRPARSRSS